MDPNLLILGSSAYLEITYPDPLNIQPKFHTSLVNCTLMIESTELLNRKSAVHAKKSILLFLKMVF